MELRRANLSDETPVRALVDAAYARWIPVIGARPEPMLRDYAAVLRHHEVWVHCAPKGRIDAMLELVEAPDHLHIANLAVSPERQGRGLGSALLRFRKPGVALADFQAASLFEPRNDGKSASLRAARLYTGACKSD